MPVPGLTKDNFNIEGLEPGQTVLDYDENRKAVWINTENQAAGKIEDREQALAFARDEFAKGLNGVS